MNILLKNSKNFKITVEYINYNSCVIRIYLLINPLIYNIQNHGTISLTSYYFYPELYYPDYFNQFSIAIFEIIQLRISISIVKNNEYTTKKL